MNQYWVRDFKKKRNHILWHSVIPFKKSSASLSDSRPVLVYDGDCGFCKAWIDLWREFTGNAVNYVSSQSLDAEVKERNPLVRKSDFDESVVLILPTGEIYRGAEAVFRTLLRSLGSWTGIWAKILWLAYQYLPGFRGLSEWSYRLVARNRSFFSTLLHSLWGSSFEPSSYFLTRWIFLRGMGFLYFLAFASITVQSTGLFSTEGILVSDLTPGFLALLCWSGCVGSILLLFGVIPRVLLVSLLGGYSILVQGGQDFLGFQWDSLLIEMGFLAIFFAIVPSRFILFLLKGLLFRVLFFSGWVKLASGDPTWRSLTALAYHFETQPLPTWLGWFLHQLPLNALKGITLFLFFVELILPFFIFLPRRFRRFAFTVFILFQVLINLAGNYGFFGWQTVVLCLLLIDDLDWRRAFKKVSLPRIQWTSIEKKSAWALGLNGILGGVLSVAVVYPRGDLARWLAEKRLFNSYGVFAVMTTQRNEVIIEGSHDKQIWVPYEFKWKPGALNRAPRFLTGHMPRWDWQMWFAALSPEDPPEWIRNGIDLLLQGNPEVTALLDKNPFPDRPPCWVRASFYEYHFTDIPTLRSSGEWWRRKWLGLYYPPQSLNLSDCETKK